jgi:hypothetical protein
MRPNLTDKKYCYNHPHRQTALICDRCKVPYCAECLVDDDGTKRCANCRSEIAAAIAAIPTFGDKLRAWGRSFLVGFIVLGVLGGIGFGLFTLYQDNFARPLTPEELARFRYAMTGSFETAEGVNVTSTVLGAKIVSATSDDPTSPAKSLINEYTGPGAPPWRSTSATFPQEVVISLENPSPIEKVILTNSSTESPDTFVRDFEVLVSATAPDSGFKSVGRFVLAPIADPQSFTFPLAQGSFVMLRVLSNQGSTAYTSLDEFNAYVIPDNPLGPPRTPTPTLSAQLPATPSPAAK